MTVCAVPALMLLVGLGVWQLQRLEWKEALIAERTASLSRPSVEVSAVPADGWQSYDLHRVTLSGRFLHDRTIEIVNRSLKGRPGVHVVTPLALADGRGTVLVDRGWAPPARDRRPGEMRYPEGDVTLDGILRAGGRPNPWFPDNEPENRIWFYADPSAMAAALGLEDARPYIVEAGPGDVAGASYPVGGQTVVSIANNHLQYALTWFGLAGTLIAIYVLYHVRRRK
ncbi:MAG: SURF1 family protein [Rhodospirillaceae bacterium]